MAAIGSCQMGLYAGPTGDVPNATVPTNGAWKYYSSPQKPGNCVQPDSPPSK